MTWEIFGIHKLHSFKGVNGKIGNNEGKLSSISKLGKLAFPSQNGIYILDYWGNRNAGTIPICIVECKEKEDSFVACQWSPIEKGCFLGAKTALGNVVVWKFEGFKRFKEIWRFNEKAICHFEWFYCVESDQINLVASTQSSVLVFHLKDDGTFVEKFSFSCSLAYFKVVSCNFGLIVGFRASKDGFELISLECKIGKSNILPFQCDSIPQIIEVFGMLLVVAMCHEVKLFNLASDNQQFQVFSFSFPEYCTVVGLEKHFNSIFVFTGECKVFRIDLSQMKMMEKDEESELFLSKTIKSIPDLVEYGKRNCFENSTASLHFNHCVAGSEIIHFLISNVSVSGYDDFFVVSSVLRNQNSNITASSLLGINDEPFVLGLNWILRLAFECQRTDNSLSLDQLAKFPQISLLLACLLNDKEQKLKFASILNPKIISTTTTKSSSSVCIYDSCAYSGEELKSPFTLECSACAAKYKLELKEFISKCILCGFPLWKSKYACLED